MTFAQKNYSKYCATNRSLRSVSTWFHLHRDFHRNKESTMIVANSTTKKSLVPIVDFCESPWAFARPLLLFVSIAARLCPLLISVRVREGLQGLFFFLFQLLQG